MRGVGTRAVPFADTQEAYHSVLFRNATHFFPVPPPASFFLIII